MLEPLTTAITQIQQNISRYRDHLSGNEIRTRIVLVDPLVSALGWNPTDPAQVQIEYNIDSSNRVDYALMGQDNPILFIEAKRLGEPLENHAAQVGKYIITNTIQYFVLTDGDHYQVFNFRAQDRKVADLRLSQTPASQAAIQLLLLWSENLAQPKGPVNPPQVTPKPAEPPEPTVPAPAPPPPVTPPTPTTEWIPLSLYQADNTAPKGIRFPDGATKGIRYYRQIITESAEWLISQNRLKDTLRATKKGKAKSQLVGSKAQLAKDLVTHHANELSNGKAIFTGYTSTQLINAARHLLSQHNIEPSQVQINCQPGSQKNTQSKPRTKTVSQPKTLPLEVNQAIQTLTQYLKDNGIANSTTQYVTPSRDYITWCEAQGISWRNTDKQSIGSFQSHLRDNLKRAPGTVANAHTAVNHLLKAHGLQPIPKK